MPEPIDTDRYGALEPAGDRWCLRFERRLEHPRARVWRALTEAPHLDAWFPTAVIGPLEAGAHLRFEFREHEGDPFDGDVVAADPPSLLEFTWGGDRLRFELHPDGVGTHLHLAVTFDELGKAARDAAGWHVCLDQLAWELAGANPPPSSDTRWEEVHEVYRAQLGPAAATLGPPPRRA